MNVRQSAERFEQAGLTEAGSLAMFGEGISGTMDVARCLIHQLDEEYARLMDGDFHTLEACWKWRVGLLGRHVVAECADGSRVEGRLREMGWDGLQLETQGGRLQILAPEKVRHLVPKGEG